MQGKKVLALVVLIAILMSLAANPGFKQLKQVSAADSCVWKEIPTVAPKVMEHIVFDLSDPSVMYAIGEGGAFVYSDDYGKSWKSSAQGLPQNFETLDIDVAKNAVFISTDQGIFKSASKGRSWVKIFSEKTSALGVFRNNPDIIFAGTFSGKIYRSLNGGSSWTVVKNRGEWISDISVSEQYSSHVIVASNDGLYETRDRGATWSRVYPERVYRCRINPKNWMNYVISATDYAGNPQRILVTYNAGSGWGELKDIRVYDFTFIPDDNEDVLYVATEKRGILKYDEFHNTVVQFDNGLPYKWMNAVSVNPLYPKIVYAVGVEFSPTAKYHLYYLSCPIDAPGNFIAQFYSDALRLYWKYPKTAERFDIFYRPEGGAFFLKLATVNGNKRSYTKSEEHFTKDVKYEFAIAACIGPNSSDKVSDTAMRLKKPKILDAILYSNTEKTATIRLAWSRTSIDKYAESITIYRSDPDCTGFICLPIAVKTIKRTDPEFQKGFTAIENLKPNREYKVYVAVNGPKNGKGTDVEWSDSKTVFIPGIPGDFEAYSTGKHIYFTWKFDKGAETNIEKFVIKAVNAAIPEIEVSPKMRSAKSYAISKSGEYDFIVFAVKGKSKTASNMDSAYLLETPQKPEVSFAKTGVKIKWDESAIDKNADKVEIMRSLGNSLWVVAAILNKSKGEYIDNPTNSYGKKVCYSVAAVRTEKGKHSDTSMLSVCSEILFESPNAPSDLKAPEVSCKGVSLSWKDNSNNETAFVVERKTKNSTYSPIKELPADTTVFKDVSVSENTDYFYRVKAVNGAGSSGYSNEVSVFVPECKNPPASPSDLNAEVLENGTVKLSWKDNSDNEELFVVERKEKSGKYSIVVKLPRNSEEFEDKSVSKGKSYFYRVKAVNDKGSSPWSNEAGVFVPLGKTVIVMYPGNPYMLVNGVKKEIDPGRGTKPVIIPKWGRTVVPIRAIVEALGGTIEWNGKERKVTINFNGTTIELWIDKPQAKVNGKAKWIDENNHDVKPIIINDRTMLPLRFVVENLGCRVEWEPKTRKITIIYPAN